MVERQGEIRKGRRERVDKRSRQRIEKWSRCRKRIEIERKEKETKGN